MRKNARLVDFQVFANSGFAGEQRALNEMLFVSYEPIRLWIKEHEISAPFRKILISVSDEELSKQWHGKVAIAADVCEVTEAVSSAALRENAANHEWVIGIVDHALQSIVNSSAWRSSELEGFLSVMRGNKTPLVHYFGELALSDGSSGVTFRPWLSIQPGLTRFGVTRSNGTQRDVTVLERAGPIFLEDEFPVHRSTIKDGNYLLLDSSGQPLASLPLDGA